MKMVFFCSISLLSLVFQVETAGRCAVSIARAVARAHVSSKAFSTGAWSLGQRQKLARCIRSHYLDSDVDRIDKITVPCKPIRADIINALNRTYGELQKTITDSFHPGQRWYILTGPPGSGKTTIIGELAKRGYGIIPESARPIIQAGFDAGIVNPWHQKNYYEDMAALTAEYECAAASLEAKIIFGDRSAIDIISYCLVFSDRFFGPQAWAQVLASLHRYEPIVFFIEGESCAADGLRPESDREAQLLGASLKETYEKLGFKVVSVPRNDVLNKRVEFILSALGEGERAKIKK